MATSTNKAIPTWGEVKNVITFYKWGEFTDKVYSYNTTTPKPDVSFGSDVVDWSLDSNFTKGYNGFGANLIEVCIMIYDEEYIQSWVSYGCFMIGTQEINFNNRSYSATPTKITLTEYGDLSNVQVCVDYPYPGEYRGLILARKTNISAIFPNI